MLYIVSHGGGVQSSCMTRMLGLGLIPDAPCDGGIFADTGAEPESIYTALKELEIKY